MARGVRVTDVLTRIGTIERVRISDDHVVAILSDGRELGIPLAWSQRLVDSTPAQRLHYEIEDFGTAVHWPDIDEDIGLATFLGVSEDVIYDALGWEKHPAGLKDQENR